MRPIALDYQRSLTERPWVGLSILMGAVALLAALFAFHRNLSDQLNTLDQTVQRLRRLDDRRQLTEASSNATSRIDDELKKRLALGSWKRWDALFNVLEASAGESVTLLSLSPKEGEITLNGEAKNLSAATAYIERLRTNAEFKDAHITEYEVFQANAFRPIRFKASSAWREPNP